MDNKNPKNPAPVEKKRNPIVFIFLGILIILLAVKVFLDYREKQATQIYYQEQLNTAKTKLDDLQLELDLRIHEIDSLGGDIRDLVEAKEQITAERDQLQRTRTANRQLIRRLSRKTEGYEELLKEKDKEIKRLKEVNESLVKENTGLKEEANDLNRSIVSLNQDKEQLQEKVQVASQLKAENIKIYAISKSGKERDGILKNRNLARLKVNFTIAKNDVAPLSAKEILLRIIDENGQVIFDVDKGSGSFILDGKETFYTAAQDILFDNTEQSITFVYEKGSDYPSGSYKAEIFTDGYLMGVESFTVK